MDFSVKDEINKILTSLDMNDTRASKMDQDDFLKLLSAFIDAGFRFTSK